MFILDRTDDGPDAALFANGQNIKSDIDLWHKRIGHVNFWRLQHLQTKQVVFGLPKFSGCTAQICEACQLGKQHRLLFPNERNRSRNKLDLIHSDVWGPAQNISLGGSRYFVSFIDDYTRHTWVYLIERKSEVFDYFRNLKGFVENESGWKIKCLRSDGGKEYFSGQFNGYLQQMGIRREFSWRYTPEQNDVIGPVGLKKLRLFRGTPVCSRQTPILQPTAIGVAGSTVGANRTCKWSTLV
jgi:hypothetical protein